jgi:hypothetical protein
MLTEICITASCIVMKGDNMRKVLLALIVIIILISCTNQTPVEKALGDNIVGNSGFENIKTSPNIEYLQTESPTTDGLASEWHLSWTNLQVKTSITSDAKNGLYAQKIVVSEDPADTQDEYRSMLYAGDLIQKLKPNTNYQLSAWVKGQGKFALAMILNKYSYINFSETHTLTTSWEKVTFDIKTPSLINDINELFRVFDENNWGNAAKGDWIIIDDYQIQEIMY